MTKAKACVNLLKDPCQGGSNYVETIQHTKAWQEAQRQKVTVSRLPALLGFYGKAKCTNCMYIEREGHIGNGISWLRNIERGRKFKAKAGILFYYQLLWIFHWSLQWKIWCKPRWAWVSSNSARCYNSSRKVRCSSCCIEELPIVLCVMPVANEMDKCHCFDIAIMPPWNWKEPLFSY